MPADFFSIFGLPQKLDIDTADLEKRYYQLTRKWHPDLNSRKGPAERLEAEEASANLNDAYRTLKDPVLRAEYLLSAHGLDLAHQSAPPDLLEEVFELNMALEELRSGDDSAKPQLIAARKRFIEMREEIDANLQSGFMHYDASAGPLSESLTNLRGILNRRNYVRNLLRDVEKELTN